MQRFVLNMSSPGLFWRSTSLQPLLGIKNLKTEATNKLLRADCLHPFTPPIAPWEHHLKRCMLGLDVSSLIVFIGWFLRSLKSQNPEADVLSSRSLWVLTLCSLLVWVSSATSSASYSQSACSGSVCCSVISSAWHYSRNLFISCAGMYSCFFWTSVCNPGHNNRWEKLWRTSLQVQAGLKSAGGRTEYLPKKQIWDRICKFFRI